MKSFEVVCPHCGGAMTVEAPVAEKKSRGQLAGIALADMTDEQLKREIINSNSVLYKSKQRGAPEATVTANQARVDAAQAEKALRQPVATATATPNLAGEMATPADETGPENSELKNEI